MLRDEPGTHFSKLLRPKEIGVVSGDPFASSCLYVCKENVKPQSVSL